MSRRRLVLVVDLNLFLMIFVFTLHKCIQLLFELFCCLIHEHHRCITVEAQRWLREMETQKYFFIGFDCYFRLIFFNWKSFREGGWWLCKMQKRFRKARNILTSKHFRFQRFVVFKKFSNSQQIKLFLFKRRWNFGFLLFGYTRHNTQARWGRDKN